jgi:hypothetical protein
MALSGVSRAGLVALSLAVSAGGLRAWSAGSEPLDGDAAASRQESPDWGSIAGLVVSADAGRPVPHARVTVAGGTPPVVRAVQTDETGAFNVTRLPPGRYTVTASRSGFVESIYGQQRPGSGRLGTPIQLLPGQALTGISVPLARGAVLTGTVVDDAGDPAIGMTVRAYRWVWRAGVRSLHPAASARVDDRGTYRIAGLLPGDYVVSATAAGLDASAFVREGMAYREVVEALQSAGATSAAPVDGALDRERRASAGGFATVYYPGVLQASAAGSVPVSVGQELSGIDIALQVVPLTDVTGIVTGPDGPAGQAQVQLIDHAQVHGVGVRSVKTGSDGRFAFAGIPPGIYTLVARATPRGGRPLEGSAREAAEFLAAARDVADAAEIAAAIRAASPWWCAMADVATGDGGMSETHLALRPGGSISGRVVVEGSETPPSLVRLTLTAVPAEQTGAADASGQPVPAPVDATGRFTIRGVMPGRYKVAIAGGAPAGYTLKSAVFAGRDVLDEPVEVSELAGPPPGAVTLTSRITEVDGVVSGSDDPGRPAPGVTVVAFAADPRFWTPGSRRIQAVRPASDGRFTIVNLPPGEYRIATVGDLEPERWTDPAFLRAVVGFTTVTVTDGVRTSVELRRPRRSRTQLGVRRTRTAHEAPSTSHRRRSVSSQEFDLHPRVVEARTAGDVGERVGHERVGRRAVDGALRPQALRQRDGSRPHLRRDARLAVHVAQLVEHAHLVAVADGACVRVVGVDLHASDARPQLAERGGDRVLARR